MIAAIVQACTSQSENQAENARLDSAEKQQDTLVDSRKWFVATGVEPFWGFRCEGRKITFSFPGKEKVEEITGNLGQFNPKNWDGKSPLSLVGSTEEGEVKIFISAEPCINAMSGDTSEYTVQFEPSWKSTENKVRPIGKLSGCGRYFQQ